MPSRSSVSTASAVWRRVGVEVLAERDRGVRAGLGDATDAGVGPAVEDGDVLGVGDPLGGLVQRVEVDVVGAALEVVELGAARRVNAAAQLDHRQHAPAHRADVLEVVQRADAAEVGGAVVPPVRAAEVDDLAGGERGLEPLLGLGVELVPALPR